MSVTSMKPSEAEDVSEERRTSATSGKISRKKDAGGEGGNLTPKKDKKLKAGTSGGGRVKTRPSAPSVQPLVEPIDRSVVASTILMSMHIQQTVWCRVDHSRITPAN